MTDLYRVAIHSKNKRGVVYIMAKKKTGPKPLNLPREPNGRISRAVDVEAMREAENKRPVVEARARMHGITMKAARDQKAGYPIGLLNLAWSHMAGADNSNAIDNHQHDALVGLWMLYVRYLRAIDNPHSLGSPGFEMVSSGLRIISDIDDADEAERNAKTRSRYNDVRTEVQSCPDIGLVGWSRVIDIACKQQPVLHNRDIAFLRLAANIINRLWSGKRKLAA